SAPPRLTESCHHRSLEHARGDGGHPDAVLRQVACRRQGQRGHPTLGCRIRGLTHLPFEGGHRGGQHQHTAVPAGTTCTAKIATGRLQTGHLLGRQAQHVHRADQVHLHHVPEVGQREHAALAQNPPGGGHPGTTHPDTQLPHLPSRLHRPAHILLHAHVPWHEPRLRAQVSHQY